MRQEELDAALKKAIQEKDILKARALIKQGADVNQTDQQGNTLLHSTSDLSADSVDMAKKKAPNEKENPVLPHEKGPQSDATRAMAEFHAPEGDKAEIHAPTPRNNHNHTA